MVKREKRYYGLDFLRAVAMLLGLAVHAPLIYYMPEIADEFGVNSATLPPPQLWVDIVLAFITAWRMPVFFLLAGFFAMLVIARRGIRRFFGDRLIRIGATFLIFATLFDLADGRFDGTLVHLWFLGYLMIFCLVFSIALSHKRTCLLLTQELSARGITIFAVCLVLLLPVAVVVNGEAVVAPEVYGDIQLGSLLYYGGYFCGGILLYCNKWLLTHLTTTKAVICLTLPAIVFYVFSLLVYDQAQAFASSPGGVLLALVVMGLHTLLWCGVMLAVSMRFITSGNRLLAWLVEVSYAVYLFHLQPVVVISVWLLLAGFAQWSAFIVSAGAGFVASCGMYYVVVKFTPVSWLLAGYKNSWLQLRFASSRS